MSKKRKDEPLDLIELRQYMMGIGAGYHLTVPTGQFWEILERAIAAEAKVAELLDALDSKSSDL